MTFLVGVIPTHLKMKSVADVVLVFSMTFTGPTKILGQDYGTWAGLSG